MGEAQFEKVEKGLECCLHNDHKNCHYNRDDVKDTVCTTEMMSDALALIRQQRARIAELEEAQRMMVYQDCLRPDWISVKDTLPAGRTNPIT